MDWLHERRPSAPFGIELLDVADGVVFSDDPLAHSLTYIEVYIERHDAVLEGDPLAVPFTGDEDGAP